MKNAPYTVRLNGTNGNDTMGVPSYYLGDPTTTAYINGCGGDDIITATGPGGTPSVKPDLAVINGGAGNDIIDLFYGWSFESGGKQYGNTIDGGAGNDTLEAVGWSTIIGGKGADTIWMGAGNQIYTDWQDTLRLDIYEAGQGDIAVHGATVDTKFDFSSITSLHQPTFWYPEPFDLTRGDLSFDANGVLQINHTDPTDPTLGSWHAAISGTPFHTDAQLDAAIGAGHVIL